MISHPPGLASSYSFLTLGCFSLRTFNFSLLALRRFTLPETSDQTGQVPINTCGCWLAGALSLPLLLSGRQDPNCRPRCNVEQGKRFSALEMLGDAVDSYLQVSNRRHCTSTSYPFNYPRGPFSAPLHFTPLPNPRTSTIILSPSLCPIVREGVPNGWPQLGNLLGGLGRVSTYPLRLGTCPVHVFITFEFPTQQKSKQ